MNIHCYEKTHNTHSKNDFVAIFATVLNNVVLVVRTGIFPKGEENETNR